MDEVLLEEVGGHEPDAETFDQFERRVDVGERGLRIAERRVCRGPAPERVDAERLVALAQIDRLRCGVERVARPVHLRVGERQHALAPGRIRVHSMGEHLLELAGRARVLTLPDQRQGEIRPKQILNSLRARLLGNRQRTFVVAARLFRVADPLVHRGDGVEALHHLERRAAFLVQRQRLQLKAQRLVEAAVRAIDAADAVVDRSELEKIRRAEQQRLGAQQRIERLFELVAR